MTIVGVANLDGDFEADRLLSERDERLDDGDEEADFADRPIGELVARICRDLGITPDWSLFEDEDWAIEENRLSPEPSDRGRRQGEGGTALDAAAPASARTHDPPPNRRPN